MIPMPSKEDMDKLRILHDKIKNHEFRKSPEKYLLDEYAELLDHSAMEIIGRYVYDDRDNRTYKYYRYEHDRMKHFIDSNSPDGYFHYKDTSEIWSNPNIALYNEAMHDFRGIWWSLRANWDNGFWHSHYFGRFTETAEKLLILMHKLIDGELITEMDFPTEKGSFDKKYTKYKFVQNPHYNNDWTLEKYLHRVWWEDKGYED